MLWQGQMFLNDAANISQVDIPASNGLIHHIDSLLIPSFIEPLLTHRCDITSTKIVKVRSRSFVYLQAFCCTVFMCYAFYEQTLVSGW